MFDKTQAHVILVITLCLLNTTILNTLCDNLLAYKQVGAFNVMAQLIRSNLAL